MNRAELEHIIRAASGVTNQADIVVIGSQSILALGTGTPDGPKGAIKAAKSRLKT
jgi:hypothetical protein